MSTVVIQLDVPSQQVTLLYVSSREVFSQAGGGAAAAEGGGGGEEEREEEEGGKSKGASSKEAKSDEFEPRAVEVRVLVHIYYYICFLKVLYMCPHAT